MRSGISISSSMSPLERPPLRTMLVTSVSVERGSILLSRARLFRSMHSTLILPENRAYPCSAFPRI